MGLDRESVGVSMRLGEGKLTTIHDRVNFYKDVYDDPGVHFEREGNRISLVTGKGIVFNDKLIIHSEDALNHAFDTYKPNSAHLNSNQQIVLEWLKEEKEERCSFESAIYWYFEDDVEPDIISDRLTQIEFLQVLQAFAEWGMKEVHE